MRAFLLFILSCGALLNAGGCIKQTGFVCHGDSQCTGPASGRCEGSGFCSFTDSSCPDGRRYGGYSGPLSNQCVPTTFDGAVPDLAVGDSAVPEDFLSRSDAARALCGNGTIDNGELCDDGPNNSDNPHDNHTCTSACQKRATCGDLNNAVSVTINPLNGHCYSVWSAPGSFMAGQSDCRNHSGYLVAITSAEENDFVKSISAGSEHWIGLTAPPMPSASPQTFSWVTGEGLAYSAFASGQPDNANHMEECVSFDPATGWKDVPCGYFISPPTGTGLGPYLPASPQTRLPYICESGCGNGIVEHGEECDPPGPACTNTCQKIRSCDAPRHVSPITGHCYFVPNGSSVQTYTSALNACSTFGSHLATLNEPAESAMATIALEGLPQADAGTIELDVWMAIKGTSGGGGTPDPINFAWDANTSDVFNPRLYHAFVAPDPDSSPETSAVASAAVMTLNDTGPGSGDGWRDRQVTTSAYVLCERELIP